jgi:hypothetical protein
MMALSVIIVGLICWIGLRIGGYWHASGPEPLTNVVRAAQSPSAKVPSLATNPGIVPPGTAISSEEVLDKLTLWLAQNPNYHALVETTLPSGTVMGRMDVFAYTNATNGEILGMKDKMFLPQAIEFQGQKKNGKLVVYFPGIDQLIEADTTKMLASMPAMAGNQSGMKGLLKLARSSFAEASADLRVATLVLSAETLNLPETSGDIYLSVRTNDRGKLLSVEEQAQGQRLISTVKYLTFDRDTVMREAPVLPVGRVAVTNKTLQAAMKEEALQVLNKHLGTKI